jgi:hypothetical protein
MDTQQQTYALETTANTKQQESRNRLMELFKNSPLPSPDLLFNLGLYTRSSLLVKFLVMYEVYQKFLNVPGVIMEFGTWWGQNLVLLENLRSILEPFNKQRKIIGFDTYSGYPLPTDADGNSAVWQEGSYATSADYVEYLEELIKTHEAGNVLGHLQGVHQLVKGDVIQTVPEYFTQHPETIVAFAYFDMGLYEPTKVALNTIKSHMVSGSVILLDELTWPEAPGEALAFKELFRPNEYSIEKIKLYPSKTIVTMK